MGHVVVGAVVFRSLLVTAQKLIPKCWSVLVNSPPKASNSIHVRSAVVSHPACGAYRLPPNLLTRQT